LQTRQVCAGRSLGFAAGSSTDRQQCLWTNQQACSACLALVMQIALEVDDLKKQ
jgi:hypothetical protein